MKKQNRKGFAPLLIILLIFGVVILTGIVKLSDLNPATLISSAKYIERPIFAYVKCEPLGTTSSQTVTVPSGGAWVKPQYESNDYEIVLLKQDCGVLNICPQIDYWVCPQQSISSNCRKTENYKLTSDYSLGHFNKYEFVYVKFKFSQLISFKDISGTARVNWQPYGLRKYDPLSSPKVLNAQSCNVKITEAWYDRIINENLINVDTSGTQNKEILAPNELIYYISGFVSSPTPSILLTYKGQDAWCSSGIIRKINIVNTANNIYYVASADISDELGRETCCPGEKQGSSTCNKNFQWEQTENTECGSFKPCDGGDWAPAGSKLLASYSCVSGKCKKEIKSVDCTTASDCAIGQLCDPKTWKCIETGTGTNLPTPIPTTPADCEKKGGTWVNKETKSYKWYNYIGIGNPEIITESYCKFASWWDWGKWIVIIGGILILLGLYPVIRGLLKSIPYLGRIIP